MSDSKGQPVSLDPTEAIKSAPSSKGSSTAAKGKGMEGPSQEKASQAPDHKGQKNMYGGPYRGDHPSSDPSPHSASFDSSKTELDGHSLKKPSKRK